MFHLVDITWAQSVLIEMGVLLLVVAVGFYLREPSGYRRLVSSMEAGGSADGEDLPFQAPPEASRANPTPEQNFDEDPHQPMKAANLTRTAKVKFVQKFNFPKRGY